MAGFVVAPNTLKVLIHWTFEGRPQLNVMHMLYTPAGPLNPNIAETIYEPISAAWVNPGGLRPLSATVLSLTGVGVIDLRSANNPEISSTSPAVPGTGTGAPMPEQVSAVITHRTALTGRSHRGRTYLFGFTPAAMAADGTISDATNTGVVNFMAGVNSGIGAAGGQLAILSPALPVRPSKPGGELPAKPFEITPVTTSLLRDRLWDTNRRRTDRLKR